MTLTTICAPSSAVARSLVTVMESGTGRPGRNFSFTCRWAIDSQTSVSCAHRRTRCAPLRPKTMARPVPQAPAPMIAISLIDWCAPSPAFRSEAVFSTSQQAVDIRVVLCDHQQRDKCNGKDHQERILIATKTEPRQHRQAYRSCNRTQRDIARPKSHDHKNNKRAEDGVGNQRRERSHRGCHSLASMEAEPHGKHVAEDGRHRRQRHHRIKVQIAVCCFHEEQVSKAYRASSFECVEDQGQNSQGRRLAGNIGGADVAAAALADIFAVKNPDEKVTEGDRSQQVARREDENQLQHSANVYGAGRDGNQMRIRNSGTIVVCPGVGRRYVSANLASLVYVDPFGDNWLWYRKNSRAVIVPNSGVESGMSFSCRRSKPRLGPSPSRQRGEAE